MGGGRTAEGNWLLPFILRAQEKEESNRRKVLAEAILRGFFCETASARTEGLSLKLTIKVTG